MLRRLCTNHSASCSRSVMALWCSASRSADCPGFLAADRNHLGPLGAGEQVQKRDAVLDLVAFHCRIAEIAQGGAERRGGGFPLAHLSGLLVQRDAGQGA